ncbi:hypothetical protein B0O99DRAFT_610635 [Bisporella sp. PMI_857]|nr:hypothetical protein B0O99DRAFT_612572 [Bisporella sp. PMI_857]KAH8600405.1 hypothetical protein B0O99DRAFT_610635 [Bisporella sp. PMI_857]
MTPVAPEDLESRVPLLMGVLIGMGSASTVAVGLRFLARARISRQVGADDWTMLVALIFSILTTITGSLAASYGMGRHIVSLESWQITNGIKLVWFARMFSQTAFGFVKLSIALLYLRIFAISKTFSIFLYCTIAFNFIVTTIWLVMTIKCLPASANWNSSQLPTAKCIQDQVTIDYAFFAGVAHSILDVTYVVLPLIFVWNLSLPSRAKFGLTILLSLGLFAAVCSMIKISKTSQLGKTQDITWEFTDLSIWNVAELNVGIIRNGTAGTAPLKRSNYVMQKDSITFELDNRTYVESSGVMKHISRTIGGGHGGSEESILKPEGKGIMQTREVEVSSTYEPSQAEWDIGVAKSEEANATNYTPK